MTNNKKTILKTILITCLCLIVIFCLFITLGVFCFTKNFANLTYNCGLYNFSSKLYSFEYNKSKDINYIAKACSIDISNNFYKNYINNFEKMIKDQNYEDFIETINKANYNNADYPLIVKSSLINEDNYYSKFYVKSLLNLGLEDKAINFAINNLNETVNNEINYKVPQKYLLSDIISESENCQCLFDFKDILVNYYFELTSYYYELCQGDIEDNIYFLSFARNLLVIGNDLQTFDKNIDIITDDQFTAINENMIHINEKITDILEANNE